jgi:ketosteroid isomerase-like protein
VSQENVDVVRRLLRAFNDGDVEALVAECDPTVKWEEQSIPWDRSRLSRTRRSEALGTTR